MEATVGWRPVLPLLLLAENDNYYVENQLKDKSNEIFCLLGIWEVSLWDITALMSETRLHMKTEK